MSLNTVSFKTTFDYTTSPKKFKFEDTTDYAGQSVSASNASGIIKVVDPSGAIYYNNINFNSPDISPGTSVFNTTTITLPLMGDGSVMQGTYTITYTVRIGATTLTAAYDTSISNTFDFSYSSPSVALTITNNCVNPELKSTDNTNYTVNATNPTITRDHRIQYPAVFQKPEITGTAKEVSTTTYYVTKNQSVQYKSTLTSTLTYDFGNNVYVSDEISGTGYADVTCDGDLCDIYCGLKSLYNRWQDNKGTKTGDSYRDEYIACLAITEQLSMAIDCGKSSDIDGYVKQIKNIAGFDSGCGCSDGTPQLVTGLGGATTTTLIDSTSIEVNETDSGGSKQYQPVLKPSLLTKINNSYNSNVTAGTLITVTTTTDGDGNKTYQVAYSGSNPSQLNSIVTLTIQAGDVPDISVDKFTAYGSKLASSEPGTFITNEHTPYATYIKENNSFKVQNIFSGSAVDYYPHIEVLNFDSDSSLDDADEPALLIPEIVTYNANYFIFRLRTPDGGVINGYKLNSIMTSIKLLIQISA